MVLCGNLPLQAEQLVIQAWKSGQGLQARGIATCIVGADGTIWIGAIGDLIRFDGVVFERVPFKLPQGPNSNRITALWEDTRRRIWCGYETGDVVVYDQTSHKAALMPIRWEREEIRAIQGDPEGETWLILDDHSIVRLSDGQSSGPKNIGGRQCFIKSNSGRLLAERGGGLFEWHKGGIWKQVLTSYDYLSCVTPSHKGGLWLVNPNWEQAFHVLDDGTLVEARTLPHQVTSALFVETMDGDLLAAVHSLGIVAIRKGGECSTYTTQEGLASHWIQLMVEDQDGNVIAISYEDLSILRRSKASTLAKIQGFGGARLTGVTGGANGRIWIITEGAGLYSLFRNTLVGIGKNTGLGNPNLWSILEDSKGRIWAGSWGEGLYNGWPDSFAPEQNWLLPDRRMVTAIIQARDGGIWAGTGEGLGRRSEQGWDWYVRSGDTLIGNVRTLCEGKDGRIWFGTTGNGVGYVEKGVPTLIAPDSDAGCRYVNCILPDADDGIWVGTEGAGLFHWAKGRWTHLRTEDGLPSNDLFHMANDCEGRIWFTSSAGVFFVQSDELACFVTRETGTIHPTIINREDGLPSDQCAGGSQNAAYLDADGRYYVPTSGGLAMIDTRASQAEEKHLHPSINRVFVDDKEVLQPDSDPLRCPPRTQSLRVEYSAPTLTHPNLVKYAYRLDGDRSSPWVQLGSSRSLQIQRPPAGLHKLEIIAWSSGLMEQAPTTTILVEQEPTLTEMLWFRVLILSLVLSAMAGAVWFYTRRTYIESQRKLELETAIEKERRRIARDIHDELGVLLAQVMLLIQGGKPVQDSGLEAGLLSRLHTKAKEITKALDELVWTINPSYDTLEGLVLYISRLSQETISNAGLRCRLRINEPADDVALDSGARHQLIMCLKEAIANAIKHSGCTQIEVMLSVEQGILKLAVHDNGCGFTPVMAGSPSPADTDHSGCDNMHARMNELGGRLVLESSPGQGTRVLFEYPLPLQ